jgi:hypothetical protein
MEEGKWYDYGSLRWRSEGFRLQPIWTLQHVMGKQAKEHAPLQAIVLQSPDDNSMIRSWELFPDAIFDRKAACRYLRPFRLKSSRCSYHRVYAARVRIDGQFPLPK